MGPQFGLELGRAKRMRKPPKTNEWVGEQLLCIMSWWIPTLIHMFYVQFYEKVAIRMAPRMVPPRLQEHFSKEVYELSREHTLARINFGIVSSIYRRVVETITVFLIFKFGFPPFIGNVLSQKNDLSLLIILYAYHLYVLFQDVTNLPLDIYFTFMLQEKYGLNRLTPYTFLRDFLDKIVPDVIQLLWIHPFDGSLGKNIVDTLCLILIIEFVFGRWLPPLPFPIYWSLFQNQQPLRDGPLKNNLESLAEHVGFPKKEIYIFTESKSSLQSNAYYLGIIFKRRIVLYDTLIRDYQCNCGDRANNNCHCERGLTNPEVEAVFCHELGHWSRGHFRKFLMFGLAMFLFLTSKTLYSITNHFVYKIWNLFGIKFGSIKFPICTLLMEKSIMQVFIEATLIARNQFSKTFEFEADEIAVNRGYGETLKSGLIKLYKDNLEFPISDPLYSKLYHTHPTLIERLEAIDQRMHELE